jgi:hypothetical protein
MVTVLLAGSACGGGSPSPQTGEKGPKTVSQTLGSRGVSLELPAGWEGRIYQRPTDQLTGVQAANSPLPLEDNDINETAQRTMGSDGILLILLVADGPPGPNVHTGAYLPTELPIRIQRSDFQSLKGFPAPVEAKRSLTINNRAVLVFAAFGRANPTEPMLNAVNDIIESLAIGPVQDAADRVTATEGERRGERRCPTPCLVKAEVCQGCDNCVRPSRRTTESDTFFCQR